MSQIIVGLYEDWLWFDERIETTTKEIENISASDKDCQRLMTIPGIGPIISTSIVSAIGSGDAFERGRDFGAWLGLVPRQYSTGGKPILGKISKTGNVHIRTLLVQAAHILLMRPHNWHKFSFGKWLEHASQHLHKNKLAVALANKLARIAWSVLYHQLEFDKKGSRLVAI